MGTADASATPPPPHKSGHACMHVHVCALHFHLTTPTPHPFLVRSRLGTTFTCSCPPETAPLLPRCSRTPLPPSTSRPPSSSQDCSRRSTLSQNGAPSLRTQTIMLMHCSSILFLGCFLQFYFYIFSPMRSQRSCYALAVEVHTLFAPISIATLASQQTNSRKQPATGRRKPQAAALPPAAPELSMIVRSHELKRSINTC